MPSAVGHALIGAGIGILFTASWPAPPRAEASGDEVGAMLAADRDRALARNLPVYTALLSVLPDADGLMHAFVAYSHPFGHRGAFHSSGFYALLALALASLPAWRDRRGRVFACFFVALLCHSLLDMATDGGLGIAVLWPLTAERFFFPWRPIPVAPLTLGPFFSDWGLRVLKVELLFALPFFAAALLVRWRLQRAKR